MHQTSGRSLLGLALSLLTAILWGILPVSLSITEQGLDIYTLNWFRYFVSFSLLAFYLKWRGNLPSFSQLTSTSPKLLFLVVFFLTIASIFYVEGIAITTPTNTEVLVQLAPLFIAVGGLVIFKERYTLFQWIGTIVLIIGLVLFFNDELAHLITTQTRYIFGSFLIVLGALSLSIYTLVQKQLLQNLSSVHTMLIVYGGCALAFTVFAKPETSFTLNLLQISMLIFSALNTLISFSALAEALEHWEASRVSAVLALAPLVTLFSAWIVSEISPDLIPTENLNLLGISGALLVVCGCAAIAINLDDTSNTTNTSNTNELDQQINAQTAFLIMSINLNREGYFDSRALNLYKLISYRNNLIQR